MQSHILISPKPNLNWIKNRIEKYGFVENQDFITLSKNLEKGGRTIEYYITLDMAKQLTMVENKETVLITSAETLTGVCIGYRPKIEQVTYSAKEIGGMLGISANRVGRIANEHGLKTKDQHSDKQVEHFRHFEKFH